MPGIVTLTMNPAIDTSTEVDSVASEIKMRCDPPQRDPGGGGINVSRAIKKIGGTSTAIFTAGGGMGDLLRDLLVAEGITLHPVPINAMTRDNMTVFERSSGLQYRFGMPGSPLSEAEQNACVQAILDSDADYVVASGSLPPGTPDDFYVQLAQRLQDTEARLIVDTSGAALNVLKNAQVFLLKPNLRELEILSGQQFSSEDHIITMARDLIVAGMAEVFVVSMGSSGAVMVSRDDAVRMRPPIVPIQSKVGAGDSMVGGLVWALNDGKSLREAVRYGIAAGTAAVMTRGTELCRREDVFDIYGRIDVLGN